MGRILAYYTCTRVKWDCGDESCEHFGCMDYPIEEHGWVDRRWNRLLLADSRNDVRPAVDMDETDPDLMDEIRDALDWLDGGYDDNIDGTFYAKDSYDPFDEPWSYSYALHFTRKYLGPRGWVEESWAPEGV